MARGIGARLSSTGRHRRIRSDQHTLWPVTLRALQSLGLQETLGRQAGGRAGLPSVPGLIPGGSASDTAGRLDDALKVVEDEIKALNDELLWLEHRGQLKDNTLRLLSQVDPERKLTSWPPP